MPPGLARIPVCQSTTRAKSGRDEVLGNVSHRVDGYDGSDMINRSFSGNDKYCTYHCR